MPDLIINVPVQCQNGHKANWVIEINGIDVHHKGVDNKLKCSCPKHDFGQGYHAVGKPFVLVNSQKTIETLI
jgi:hypothetical protein